MIGGACDIGAYEAPASLAFAEWEPNESVEVGDMMTFEDAAWQVVIPHTTSGWEPPKVCYHNSSPFVFMFALLPSYSIHIPLENNLSGTHPLRPCSRSWPSLGSRCHV